MWEREIDCETVDSNYDGTKLTLIYLEENKLLLEREEEVIRLPPVISDTNGISVISDTNDTSTLTRRQESSPHQRWLFLRISGKHLCSTLLYPVSVKQGTEW